MNAARSALGALVDVLAGAVSAPVVIDTGQPVTDLDPVLVQSISLDRVGRSQRDGPLLDLSLTVEVTATGPQALETVEQLMVAVELSPWCVLPPVVVGGCRPSGLPGPARLLPAEEALLRNGIGFSVRLPVSVPIAEPAPPLVTQVPVVRVEVIEASGGRPTETERVSARPRPALLREMPPP